jgi:hypothetical protein
LRLWILRESGLIGVAALFRDWLLVFHLLLQRLHQFLERSHFVAKRFDFGAGRRRSSGGRRFRRLSGEARRNANGERHANKSFHLVS